MKINKAFFDWIQKNADKIAYQTPRSSFVELAGKTLWIADYPYDCQMTIVKNLRLAETERASKTAISEALLKN